MLISTFRLVSVLPEALSLSAIDDWYGKLIVLELC